jgi:nicotinamide-nucleotide amidase
MTKHTIKTSELVLEISKQLLTKKWRMATAESCTGGMVSAALTELSGSSNWFERAYVTYSNLAKHEDLGVPKDLITEHGAVSLEVAQAMAKGLVTNSSIDIGLAITGVAGPTGGSKDKPVGYVCFAWAWKDQNGVYCKADAQHFVTAGSVISEQTRYEVRCLARDFSLEQLLLILKSL